MNDRKYQDLSKWLLPILYVLLAFAMFQLLTTFLSIFEITQMQSNIDPAMDRDILPMIMGASTENLLICVGLSVKYAKLISMCFALINAMSYIALIAMVIQLSRNTFKENTPFFITNLSRIRVVIIIYVGLPLVQCLFNCIIIVTGISAQYLMNYLYSSTMNLAYIVFMGIMMMFIVSSFQHGIELQDEADETL